MKGKSLYEKTLLKCTYPGDFLGPKDKHIDYIIMVLSRGLEQVRIKEGAEKLVRRLESINWVGCLKNLLVMHKITGKGNRQGTLRIT